MVYIEYFLILISTFTGCVFISAYASLVGIPKAITSFAIRLKICLITARIEKYKSIIKKKKKKHDKILSLDKFKALIYSNISQVVFLLINNVPK